MRPFPACALLLFGAVAVPGAAQETGTVTDSATVVHRGWLLEILDGDMRGAAALYAQAADDETVPAELRALALARRVELERLRPGAPELTSLLNQLVDLLRSRGDDIMRELSGFSTAGRPVPTDGLAEAAALGEDELRAWLQSESRQPPRTRDPLNTRPLVPALYDRFLGDLAEARRARDDVAAQRLWRELSQPSRSRRFRNVRAIFVLNLVLAGQQERADRLRGRLPRYQTRPVPMPNDPVQALDTALIRLESELARVDLNPEERTVLGRLLQRLAETNEDQATQAVEMLRNLPVYGELLLSPRQR